MKKILPIFTALCLSTAASAQSDTIPETRELQEITVESANQYVSASSSTYIPSKRQKNSAADAVSLLSRMAIPQIDVNPADRTVRTSTGKEIAILLRSETASAAEFFCRLEGM